MPRRFRGSSWILISSFCHTKTVPRELLDIDLQTKNKIYLHSVMPRGFRGSSWIFACVPKIIEGHSLVSSWWLIRVPKTINNYNCVVQRRFHGSSWILCTAPPFYNQPDVSVRLPRALVVCFVFLVAMKLCVWFWIRALLVCSSLVSSAPALLVSRTVRFGKM